MTLGPYFCIACGVIGCASGAAAGAQSSVMFGIVGGFAGLLFGIFSFFAITVPYVGWIIRYSPKTSNPPLVWGMLFMPLMILSLILTAIVPFCIFRSS